MHRPRIPEIPLYGVHTCELFTLAVNRRQLGEISKDTRRGSGSRRGLEFAYVYVEAYRSPFVTVIDESGKNINTFKNLFLS